jgi:DNA-directed RNA polymerase subunit RPC12/RpoP
MSDTGRLAPLECPACRAPVPLGETDEVACPYCAAAVAIPEDYRALRDSSRGDAEALARAAEMFAALGRPPSAFARFLIRKVGTLLLIGGLLIPVPVILVILFIHFGGTPFGLQLYDVLSDAQQTALGMVSPLVFAAVGYLLVGAARKRAIAVGRIKAALAARPPPRSSGRALCRTCGAALEYGPEALGARCLYCNSDNLLRMPRQWLDRMQRYQAPIKDAWLEFIEERRRHRRRLAWRSALAAPILAIPVLVLWRGCGPPDNLEQLDPNRTPDWRAALETRGMSLPCTGGNIDLGPIILAPEDCFETGCMVRRLLPLRRGETVRLVTGAPEEIRRAWPLPPRTGVRIDRHVMQFVGDDHPDSRAWGEEIARVFPRPGIPATFRAPASGWFRATTAIAEATPGQYYSLCFEIRPAE